MFILRVKYSKQSNFPSFNILKNGCTMIMKRVNSKDRLQIYKNNNLIANIFANDENLTITLDLIYFWDMHLTLLATKF